MLPGAVIWLVSLLGWNPGKVVRRVRVLDVDAELDGGVAIGELVGVVTDDEDEPQLCEDSDGPYLMQANMRSKLCSGFSAGTKATRARRTRSTRITPSWVWLWQVAAIAFARSADTL